ncbi:ATP-binding protein [Spirillospora sp. CA-255316]
MAGDGGDRDRARLALDLAPVTVSGDPVLLNRLVANLLDNAVRYNRPGGSVEVGLSAAGVLTVRNTGPQAAWRSPSVSVRQAPVAGFVSSPWSVDQVERPRPSGAGTLPKRGGPR